MVSAESVHAWRDSQRRRAKTLDSNVVNIEVGNTMTDGSIKCCSMKVCGDYFVYFLLLCSTISMQVSTYTYVERVHHSLLHTEAIRSYSLIPSVVLFSVAAGVSIMRRLQIPLIGMNILPSLVSASLVFDYVLFLFMFFHASHLMSATGTDLETIKYSFSFLVALITLKNVFKDTLCM